MTREEFLKRLHQPIDLRNNGIKVIKPSMQDMLEKRKKQEQAQPEKDIEK